jgi:hypothetical protein
MVLNLPMGTVVRGVVYMRGVEWRREMVEVSWIRIHPYFFHIPKWLFPIECSGWYERLPGVYLQRKRKSGKWQFLGDQRRVSQVGRGSGGVGTEVTQLLVAHVAHVSGGPCEEMER